MRVEVTSNIDIPKHMRKVRDDAFWTFAANKWWTLITPYVPMDTGTLSETVTIRARDGNGEIEYTSPYAKYVYYGKRAFRKDNHPLATSQWDKAAKLTQEPELLRSMQDYIDSGRLF